MSIALYKIAQEHRAMVDALLDSTDDAQAIADTIEGESYPLEQKAQLVAYAPKMLDAEADEIEKHAKEMLDRAKAKRKRAENIREYLRTCMEVAGVKKIDCPMFCIALKANPPSVEIFEPAILPEKYWKLPDPPPAVPVKARIKEDLEAGIDVPGAKINRGSMRIEIK